MPTCSINYARDIAAQFVISVRTVYRDVAHLQASGMTIEGEASVGHFLKPGFNLAPML